MSQKNIGKNLVYVGVASIVGFGIAYVMKSSNPTIRKGMKTSGLIIASGMTLVAITSIVRNCRRRNFLPTTVDTFKPSSGYGIFREYFVTSCSDQVWDKMSASHRKLWEDKAIELNNHPERSNKQLWHQLVHAFGVVMEKHSEEEGVAYSDLVLKVHQQTKLRKNLNLKFNNTANDEEGNTS